MLKLHKMADWACLYKDKFSADVQGYCKFAQLAKSCITKTPWNMMLQNLYKKLVSCPVSWQLSNWVVLFYVSQSSDKDMKIFLVARAYSYRLAKRCRHRIRASIQVYSLEKLHRKIAIWWIPSSESYYFGYWDR